MQWDFSDKWYLITGASSGIGEATARLLDSCNANTVLVSRNQERLQMMINEFQRKPVIIPYDLTSLDNVEDIFLKCSQLNIVFDGMIHSAGISEDIPIKMLETEDIELPMKIHYEAFVLLGKYFTKKKNSHDGASIVALSSGASFTCEKSMVAYAASKAALNAAIQVMSKEYVHRRIRVNGIAPCFVDTDMTWNVESYIENFRERVRQVQPLGVIPKEQIAYLIAFLLSDYSTYITGNIIPVTGGQTI